MDNQNFELLKTSMIRQLKHEQSTSVWVPSSTLCFNFSEPRQTQVLQALVSFQVNHAFWAYLPSSTSQIKRLDPERWPKLARLRLQDLMHSMGRRTQLSNTEAYPFWAYFYVSLQSVDLQAAGNPTTAEMKEWSDGIFNCFGRCSSETHRGTDLFEV
eukprot:6456785-Amphidinium_carterae.1